MRYLYAKHESRRVGMVSKTLIIVTLFVFLEVGDLKQNKHKPIRPYRGRVTMIPEFVSLCPNQSLPVSMAEFRVENVARLALVIDGEVQVDRDLRRFTKAVVKLDTCEDRNEGTCHHFQTLRFYDESCTIIEQKDAFWSPVVNSVDPKIQCPITAGRYAVRNATMDVHLLQMLPLPLERYLWRVRVEAFDPELVVCIHGAARFLRVRT